VKRIVVDANVIMGAVLGKRIFHLMDAYHSTVLFFSCATAINDARKYVPQVLRKRGATQDEISKAIAKLDVVTNYLIIVSDEDLAGAADAAKPRISDLDDWLYVALALVLDCPIWTEDKDFFGCGVPLWKTATVEIFLQSAGLG
jgi:predicted nucleic acid-binding protein